MRKWDDLPDIMKNGSVRRYYEILSKKKASLFLNRVLDFIFGLIILGILSPVFLAVCIAVKASSQGPVLFKQERVTQYGKLFYIYKFRTMVQHADNTGPKIATDNDARVTKTGKYLRKKHLDEIPQLLNIIKGEMTFVGTRPEVAKFVDKYTDEMMATLLLRAGVTSKASIQYKNEKKIINSETDTEKAYVDMVLPGKMKINLKSIEEYSIPNEIGVLIRTVIKPGKKNKNMEIEADTLMDTEVK